MKKSLLVLLIAFSATLAFAQENVFNQKNNNSSEETEVFNRKGKILIETGYNLFGGLPIGGGTGFTVISDGDDRFSGLGFNGGYFISQNFALKLNYSNLTNFGSGVSTIGIGAKYYIAGKVPIDFSIGSFGEGGGNGSSSSYFTASVGYGIRLADNINLEPSLGLFGNSDDAISTFNLNFSMFL